MGDGLVQAIAIDVIGLLCNASAKCRLSQKLLHAGRSGYHDFQFEQSRGSYTVSGGCSGVICA